MLAQNSLSHGGLLPVLDAEKQLQALESGFAAAVQLDWLFDEVSLDDLTSYDTWLLTSWSFKQIKGTWEYTAC